MKIRAIYKSIKSCWEIHDDFYNKIIEVDPNDGDVIVAINGGDQMAGVEFCQCGIGGGRSPATLRALKELFIAMEQDNYMQNCIIKN
jgi:hypothetical protein